MTKKQRVSLWRRMSKCFHHHEMTMIEQDRKKRMKSRMDIIGQNGNDGEHYAEVEKAQLNNRGNWYGLADDWEDEDPLAEIKRQQDAAEPGMFRYKVDGRHPEPDATGAEDEVPNAAEDCARVKGNYEL